MGCHTWCYKKLSALPQEITDELIKETNSTIKEEMQELSSFEDFCTNEQDAAQTYINWYREQEHPTNVTYWEEYSKIENIKKRYDKRVENVMPYRNGVSKENLADCLKIFGDATDTTVFGQDIYVELGCDFLPIRISRYPEKTFRDMDALREFIISESQKGNVSIIKDCSLVAITSENLNECLQLFDDFVNKHGKDNLYVEFG